MCLIIKKNEQPQMAKEDIVVYKHIIRDDEFPDVYKTSFQYAPVKIGETYSSKLEKDDAGDVSIGLHAYAYLHDADSEADGYHETLVQCTIPKGSMFYIGRFGGMLAYASDTLRYDEVINNY